MADRDVVGKSLAGHLTLPRVNRIEEVAARLRGVIGRCRMDAEQQTYSRQSPRHV